LPKIISNRGKSDSKIRATSAKKLRKVNNRPIGEKSANLVTVVWRQGPETHLSLGDVDKVT
jgi:hypothetical protein